MLFDITTLTVLHAACAMVYALLTGMILIGMRPSRTGLLLAGACSATIAWAVAVCLQSAWPAGGIAGELEMVRAVAWYGFALHVYRRIVTRRRDAPQILVSAGIGAAFLLGTATLLDATAPLFGTNLWLVAMAARLGLAVCNILLIENLYLNCRDDVRWHINLLCIALGAVSLYDLVLYSDALLFRRLSILLFEGRASVTAIVAPLLAVAAARNRTWKVDIHVSRSVVFHSASLIASGIFLVALALAGEVFRNSGAAWGGVAETSIIFAGIVAVAVVLTSGTARSHIRSLVVDHFFSLRYDYRREWARCIATLSSPETYSGLQARAIRAVAEVVDSPGGILFVRDPQGAAFLWSGSWNFPAAALHVAQEDAFVAAFREGTWVVEVSRMAAPPAWLQAFPDVWIAVPLNHGGQLIGFVLVARSRAPFKLDREAFDLLRIVGREVAGHVAEQRARGVLAQARELQSYGKRFAFVIHDIKNVSSQLSMLLQNAEVHADNPEFQRDMLKTVRSSVSKITALLGRLQSRDDALDNAVIVPAQRLPDLTQACAAARGVSFRMLADGGSGNVVMDPATFDAIVAHLLDNAVEASTGTQEVTVSVEHAALSVTIDITDRGCGMSPEFVRDQLFRPFASTKRGGHGIGAYQARELIREAGGDLLVISEPNMGTTMRMLLPSVATAIEEPVVVRAG